MMEMMMRVLFLGVALGTANVANDAKTAPKGVANSHRSKNRGPANQDEAQLNKDAYSSDERKYGAPYGNGDEEHSTATTTTTGMSLPQATPQQKKKQGRPSQSNLSFNIENFSSSYDVQNSSLILSESDLKLASFNSTESWTDRSSVTCGSPNYTKDPPSKMSNDVGSSKRLFRETPGSVKSPRFKNDLSSQQTNEPSPCETRGDGLMMTDTSCQDNASTPSQKKGDNSSQERSSSCAHAPRDAPSTISNVKKMVPSIHGKIHSFSDVSTIASDQSFHASQIFDEISLPSENSRHSSPPNLSEHLSHPSNRSLVGDECRRAGSSVANAKDFKSWNMYFKRDPSTLSNDEKLKIVSMLQETMGTDRSMTHTNDNTICNAANNTDTTIADRKSSHHFHELPLDERENYRNDLTHNRSKGVTMRIDVQPQCPQEDKDDALKKDDGSPKPCGTQQNVNVKRVHQQVGSRKEGEQLKMDSGSSSECGPSQDSPPSSSSSSHLKQSPEVLECDESEAIGISALGKTPQRNGTNVCRNKKHKKEASELSHTELIEKNLNLTRENDQLKRELAHFKGPLKESVKDILYTKLPQLELQLQNMTKERNKLRLKVALLQHRFRDDLNDLKTLRKKNDDLEERLAEMRKDLDGKPNELHQPQIEDDPNSEQANFLQNAFDKHQLEIGWLSREKYELVNMVKDLEVERQGLKDTHVEDEFIVDEQEKEIDNLKAVLLDVTNLIANNNSYDIKARTFSALVDMVIKMNNDIETLNKQVQSLKNEKASLDVGSNVVRFSLVDTTRVGIDEEGSMNFVEGTNSKGGVIHIEEKDATTSAYISDGIPAGNSNTRSSHGQSISASEDEDEKSIVGTDKQVAESTTTAFRSNTTITAHKNDKENSSYNTYYRGRRLRSSKRICHQVEQSNTDRNQVEQSNTDRNSSSSNTDADTDTDRNDGHLMALNREAYASQVDVAITKKSVEYSNNRQVLKRSCKNSSTFNGNSISSSSTNHQTGKRRHVSDSASNENSSSNKKRRCTLNADSAVASYSVDDQDDDEEDNGFGFSGGESHDDDKKEDKEHVGGDVVDNDDKSVSTNDDEFVPTNDDESEPANDDESVPTNDNEPVFNNDSDVEVQSHQLDHVVNEEKIREWYSNKNVSRRLKKKTSQFTAEDEGSQNYNIERTLELRERAINTCINDLHPGDTIYDESVIWCIDYLNEIIHDELHRLTAPGGLKKGLPSRQHTLKILVYIHENGNFKLTDEMLADASFTTWFNRRKNVYVNEAKKGSGSKKFGTIRNIDGKEKCENIFISLIFDMINFADVCVISNGV